MDLVVGFERMVTALVPCTLYGSGGLLGQCHEVDAGTAVVGAAVAAGADSTGRATAAAVAASTAIRRADIHKPP